MSNTTHPTPIRASGDVVAAQARALDAPIRLTREWTEAWLRGLDSVSEAQRAFVRRTPLEPFTELLVAPAEATRRVVEGYAAALAALPVAAERAGRMAAETAERAGRQVEETVEHVGRKLEATTERAARELGEATERTGRKAAGTAERAVQAASGTAERGAGARSEAESAPAEPPIARYDDLTADEVVAKLPELPQGALAEVEAYERGNRARSTVLDRIEALRGDEPAPDYDGRSASEVQALLKDGDADLARRVRDYERRHKNRSGVIQAAERRLERA